MIKVGLDGWQEIEPFKPRFGLETTDFPVNIGRKWHSPGHLVYSVHSAKCVSLFGRNVGFLDRSQQVIVAVAHDDIVPRAFGSDFYRREHYLSQTDSENVSRRLTDSDRTPAHRPGTASVELVDVARSPASLTLETGAPSCPTTCSRL
jgi:hypothetical protein